MVNGLYTLLLLELVMGGGGRLVPIGPVTLRIVVFFMTLIVWVLAVALRKYRSGQGLALFIVYAFCLCHLPALLTDATSLRLERQQFAQIQGLLFMFSAPFVAMAVNSISVVERSASIIIFGGLISALALFCVILLLYFGFINFSALYEWSLISEEITFRSENQIFSKGLFFIAIALIFAVTLRPRFWILISMILALCIVLSLTRGIVAAAFISVMYSLAKSRRISTFYILVIVLIIVGFVYIREIAEFFVGSEDRASSIQTRLDDFQVFLLEVDFRMLMMGDGFGSSLNNRHAIENSYIWAIWRFGVFGFLFWISPFFISYYFYRKVKSGTYYGQVATAYFSGMIMLGLVTATNPFINNSIGILYSLISIFSLRQLALQSKGQQLYSIEKVSAC
jgi:hypothetical protein